MKLKNTYSSHKLIGILMTVAILSLLAINLGLAQGPNLIKNSSFENGFVEGVGIANDWERFYSNNVQPGFYDEDWRLAVFDGEHSQLIELNHATSQDSYAGIYQKVAVTPGQAYKFSFKGLVRSDEGDNQVSGYGYMLQFAVDTTGNEDWQKVSDWKELPAEEQPRTGPNGNTYTFTTGELVFKATGKTATVFIRAWKKWPGSGEGNYDIDVVRLVAVDASELPPSTSTDPGGLILEPDAVQPLPETGQTEQNVSTGNLFILLSSIILILFLVGGAFINQKRRRLGN